MQLTPSPSPTAKSSSESPQALRERSSRVLSTMPKQPCDPMHDYVVDPDRVAEALLARIEKLADERARFRRSLIYSVEMIEAPDGDGFTVRAL